MMNVMNYQSYDVIHEVFNALQKENMERAEELLDGKFKTEVLREEVNGVEYLDVYRRIKEGMPDAKFEIIDLTTDGDTFKAKLKIKGTHTKPLPSMKRGWKTLKPTGKRINRVVTSVEIVLRSNRIIEIRNLEEGKGVVAGLLNVLDILPKSYSKN